MSAVNARRVLHFLKQEVARQTIPHGMVHWRYFLPGQPRLVRTHRHFWRTGMSRIPGPLAWGLEFWLWLRWVSWGAWRATWHCVSRNGAIVASREGHSRTWQARRVLELSLAYCISPQDIYRFRLYRDPSRVWEYVYIHETGAFHRWRGRSRDERPASLTLLQNKQRLSERLQDLGLPVARTLTVVPRGAAMDLRPWLVRHHRLFCKPCHGARGEGAFRVEKIAGENRLRIRTFAGEVIAESDVAEFMRRQTARDDYLIQPHLTNTAELACLTDSDEAITIRLITEQGAAGIKHYCGFIEIPTEARTDAGNKQQLYVCLPIDLEAGILLPLDEDRIWHSVIEITRSVQARAQGVAIPGWTELKNCALKAHGIFPDVHAIAWDFVITPDGPMLLEGNSGWGVRFLQVLYGGLLGRLGEGRSPPGY